MNDTLAIVVTYNRLTTLRSCIAHLMQQTADCDILIVDNASTDGTGDWAQSQAGAIADKIPSSPQFSPGKTLLYENTGANLGGAGGFNYGLRRACELGYTYAWIMDDDAFAEPDCLSMLLDAANTLSPVSEQDIAFSADTSFRQSQMHGKSRGTTIAPFGFLSSIVLWTDGSLCRMNWQRKLHLPKKRAEHHITEKDLGESLIPIQSATFVSLLFPTEVVRRVGLPIKEFFIWCDDIEYTRRIALKYQLPCYAVSASRIVHHIANNVGTDLATDSADRIDRYNYAFRNENYMYRQYGLKGFGYYILVCIYNIYKVLRNAPDNRGKRLGVVFRNFFKGLRFNPPVEQVSRMHP